MPNTPNIAALVSARICHDLISPIGAIGNGVELLMLDKTAASPEMNLIAESVMQASARIRFFRLAYGSGSADQRIARSEVAATLSAMTLNSRLQITLQAPRELSRQEVKLAFLLLQCLETMMPWGGAVALINQGTQWVLNAESPRLRDNPNLWEQLTSEQGMTEVLPTSVQFTLAWQELRRLGRVLRHANTPATINLTF